MLMFCADLMRMSLVDNLFSRWGKDSTSFATLMGKVATTFEANIGEHCQLHSLYASGVRGWFRYSYVPSSTYLETGRLLAISREIHGAFLRVKCLLSHELHTRSLCSLPFSTVSAFPFTCCQTVASAV